MLLETIVVGALETNCYIIADDATKDAAIIDPGAEGKRIAKRVEDMGLTVRYILVTHGHMDHMKDAPLLSEIYGCPIVVHREEMEYIHSPEVKASPYSAQVFQTFETAVHDNGMLVEDEQHLPLGALGLARHESSRAQPGQRLLLSRAGGDRLWRGYSVLAEHWTDGFLWRQCNGFNHVHSAETPGAAGRGEGISRTWPCDHHRGGKRPEPFSQSLSGNVGLLDEACDN